MTIDSDIRDQAYQFFIQEAPELLQVIETELLTLRQERSTAKVHNMMRAAHSIKGGAASVGLETLKTLAHSLEDIFKGLHNEELEIDIEVESLLLQAYDCLRLPLMEQITTGQFNPGQAMAMAEPVFAEIEAQLGDFLKGAANLPSSVELGVDIALSIFEVDVAQGLERLITVLAAPQGKEVAGELRAQAEVFTGIAELLNLPGFGAIAQTAIAALDAHPTQALQITQLALTDFQAARQAVLAGDRTQGGTPSTALVELAIAGSREQGAGSRGALEQGRIVQPPISPKGTPSSPHLPIPISLDAADDEVITNLSLDDVFGDFALAPQQLHPDLIETVNEQENIPEIFLEVVDAEVVEQAVASPVIGEEEHKFFPSLDDVFGDFDLSTESAALDPSPPTLAQSQQLHSNRVKTVNTQESIQELVQSVEQTFSSLPPIQDIFTATDNSAIFPSPHHPITPSPYHPITPAPAPANKPAAPEKPEVAAIPTGSSPGLSVRVDLQRLEQMNNLVGELAINRNGLSLQNEQLQKTVQELLRRFAKFQEMGRQLRDLSDRMLVAPERYRQGRWGDGQSRAGVPPAIHQADFDSLEMDSYGELHSLLQGTLEEVVQLEETVGDVVHLAGQSSQTLEQQRQMLGYLRDDLMWARMLPLGEMLNRFPRILRDLSTSYEKPVELKLSGTGVLVDKAVLEKLYDPLLHLLRNAFDHGIEPPEARRQQGKRSQGQIEIRAYHQGSQTIIEVRDDGRGINLERIGSRARDMALLSPEQLATASTSELLELLFEPGFSTASQVSELSGRGVGLDVVRSQLRSLKGTVTISSEPGIGTTFTLRIPLTLTIAKLLVCFVGSTAFALPSDSIAEILIPKPDQIKQSGGQRFLHWENQIIPAYHLSELVHYACPLPEAFASQVLVAVPTPEDWAPPMLLIEQDLQILALEIDRLVTEQELVIKPLGAAIAPPSYIYGCTILGDGSLIPVIDGAALLNQVMSPSKRVTNASTKAQKPASAAAEDSSITADAQNGVTGGTPPTRSPAQRNIAPTLLVVDDSITLRQTIALTLQKAGYRVLQARDGREAIDQLQQNSTIQLVVCDVEMPNMNGFEFLSHRRQDPVLSKIPVVMLTSRSSDKHQQLAMHLGAKAYFTKPYIEREFLAHLETIIKQNAPVGVPALAHSP